ncbi:DapH/DapD/GlmU-related protein [Hymenobacter sp.]|uniref:DapH/DapD/GlmU-related protein n=1 Tax=Hymenobacter sp. TaxID=1898978 RepID=UPI00286A29E6|nr:DapH/DapD/GlmU-related protein [Hymenobacter sp.]
MTNKLPYYVHPAAIVDTADIGAGTTIWAFVHVLNGVSIGANCNICDHCFIEDGVVIGSNVTLKCGVYLWTGVTAEDNVFIGPNVVFTNDVRPRSKNKDFALAGTLLKFGCSLGANSTILAGVTVGRHALTGIASVVTRDVKDYALVYGNPARQHGWVDEQGEKLHAAAEAGQWYSLATGQRYREAPHGLVPETSLA